MSLKMVTATQNIKRDSSRPSIWQWQRKLGNINQ